MTGSDAPAPRRRVRRAHASPVAAGRCSPRSRRPRSPRGVAVGAGPADDGGGGAARGSRTRGAARARRPRREAGAPVERLTLRQQVGQLIVLRFAGTTAPATSAAR